LHISTGLKQCVVELGHQTDLKFMMIVMNSELGIIKRLSLRFQLSVKRHKKQNLKLSVGHYNHICTAFVKIGLENDNCHCAS